MVTYVGVEHLVGIIRKIGIRQILTGMAEYIEADFRRWETFEKTPRVASRSPQGVIELMPTSDGRQFAFKYVNGHHLPLRLSRRFLRKKFAHLNSAKFLSLFSNPPPLRTNHARLR